MRLDKLVTTTALLLSLAAYGCSGEDGEKGMDGADGANGMDGANGADGADGMNGAPGMDGANGMDGMDGAPGMDGMNGVNGAPGMDGMDGTDALIKQTEISSGTLKCVQFDSGSDADDDGVLGASEVDASSLLCQPAAAGKTFKRVATFPVCSQIDPTCDTDDETAAEIVAASKDGMTLIYSDSPKRQIGFINIADPKHPMGMGTLDVGGEPTSVAVAGDYVLVGVNTTGVVDRGGEDYPDYDNPTGELAVVDIATQSVVETIDLGGQPDSVAVSPDGMYAAIAIENERDEEDPVAGEDLPQAPAGELISIALSGAPDTWTPVVIAMTSLNGAVEPTDPEPEYVDINADNIAVVTLQENNAIAVVDLTTNTVLNGFSAGTVDLDMVDIEEEDQINQTESLTDVPREPDGVTWISADHFVTADEGDWNGGSRGFTVWDKDGNVVYGSGNMLDHMTARFGHYPEGRSENKGNEPENAEYAVFEGTPMLFVNSERSSLVFAFDVSNPAMPVFKQVLPAAAGPEGALAIASRNLLVVASEEDNRGDGLRSAVNIYSYDDAPATYPTLMSANRLDGSPIPWAALSGLAADPVDPHILYSVEDSAFIGSRIFTIDTSTKPAVMIDELRIVDDNDVLAGIAAAGTASDTEFDVDDLDAMINDDKSVNLDPEGIAVATGGGFWIASEGSGTVSDSANRPVESLNLIVKVDEDGVIETVVTLPDAVNDNQLRFGFEGIAEYDGKAYVAFQRVWGDTGDTHVRIGIFDPSEAPGSQWNFAYYPLDAVESQNGGWVGLSDITSLGDGTFLVLERDNQPGPDAAIKRIYHVDLNGATLNDTNSPVDKTLVRDLMPHVEALGGLVPEKFEGSAVDAMGNLWVVNDNDGVDDNSGETLLLNLGRL